MNISEREGGTGSVNGSLELSCDFQGFPLPEISWLFQVFNFNSINVRYIR